MLDGDDAAVRELLERYDRLVRYTVFRSTRRQCARDNTWLEARANEAWAGIFQALRRLGPHNRPAELAPYITRIARNKSLDALRSREASEAIPFEGVDNLRGDFEPEDERAPDPSLVLENFEQVAALRDCMSHLSEKDKLLCAEIELIMAKRWHEASERLGIAESSLRSRWERVLGKLKNCLEKKSQEFFAPERSDYDS